MSKYQAFANRLRKNQKHWDKWARRQGLSCYRLFDRDLPEFPLAIDRYGEHLHVQEFKTQWEPDDAEYAAWLDETQGIIAVILDVPEDHIHYKLRQRQRGKEQYQKTGERGQELVVGEQGLRFLVNLDAYLDTGLFLDHRLTRAMVRDRAAGKRFLNLFAYTGSFTVYAAAGGAASSLTIDLSKTYQAWTARNLELNGVDTGKHRLQQEDVLAFLKTAASEGPQYDLIVMDPPSFSNSKRMTDTLDVQRDHAELIQLCMRLLSSDGELFFSNNKRGFKLDPAIEQQFDVRDITRQTLPEDFRARGAHQCWIIRQRD